MDPLTQAVLGGATASVLFHRSLGRKAFLVGAVGGAMPDLDVLYKVDHWSGWQHHRGITHSLFFAPVVGPLLGWLSHRLEARRRGRAAAGSGAPAAEAIDTARGRARLLVWMAAWTVAIFSHPILDLFTAYGTQLLAPFSDHRFAINAMAIIDPLYTLPLLAAGIVCLLAPRRVALVRASLLAALIVTTAYLGYSWWLNRETALHARQDLEARGLEVTRIASYPTIFQTFYRRIVAHTPGQVHVGYRSALADGTVHWRSFAPEDHPAILAFLALPEGRLFDWFSMGQHTHRVVAHADRIEIFSEDIRYGLPDAPQKGLWGVRTVFSADGRVLEPPRRFRHPRELSRGTLAALWRAVKTGRMR